MLGSSKITTIGAILNKHQGIGPGFDQVRAVLALSIFLWHSVGMAYGPDFMRALPIVPFRSLAATMLPMFFALSGFLVTASAIRTNSLSVFLTSRGLRILPALCVEILLSALILGPLLTTVPIATYFSSPEFLEYFGSVIGRVRAILPGLFLTNYIPRVVNGALWTLGAEALCYVAIALLMLLLILQKRGLVLKVAFAYLALCVTVDIVHSSPIIIVLPTKSLIFSFIVGSLIYLYRDRVAYHPLIVFVVFVASTALAAFSQFDSQLRAAVYPAVIGLTYVVVALGLTTLPKLPVLSRGDYSYGIYLYHWPILQSVASFFPGQKVWWLIFLFSFPTTLLFAAASWHLIEKPALALRKHLTTRASNEQIAKGNIWTVRRVALASLLVLYGVFVAYSDDVFPIRAFVLHYWQGKEYIDPFAQIF